MPERTGIGSIAEASKTKKIVGFKHTCVYKDCDIIVVQRIEPGQKFIEIKRFACVKHIDKPYREMRSEEMKEK